MRRSFFGIALSALAGVVLWGCYPGGPDYYEDTDVVFTTYDVDYVFQGSNTYAMPDKIVVDVEIDRGDTTFVYMKDVFAAPILQAIDRNMLALGWAKTAINGNPDLVLTPAGMKSTTFFYSYWYDWWYGGWYPGWGWYYPPYYNVSSYTTGSFIMVFADPNIDNPVDRSPAAWLSAANGLMSGAYDVSRVTDAIDQAFRQSPYLKVN
jgi:hypothetical protein